MESICRPIIVAESNNSTYGVALYAHRNIYCSLLVPTIHIGSYKSEIEIDVYPDSRSQVKLKINVRPLVTVRPLMSSVCFSYCQDKIFSAHSSPCISICFVKGGLTIPITVTNLVAFDTSVPLCIATLVGSDYRYASDYISHVARRRRSNILLFTDHRMSPDAAADISRCVFNSDNEFIINIIPVVSPYYSIVNFDETVNHARPADTGTMKQQRDYFFVLLPLTCMLGHMICRDNNIKFLTFADMDERQVLSDKFYSFLADTDEASHYLIEEINIYASDPGPRREFSYLAPDDLVFPFGRILRNRKTFFLSSESLYALDSPHGVVEDYARYRIIQLRSAFYLHFFNITLYKRLSFIECLSKVDKFRNFRASQVNPGLLSDYGLELLSEFLSCDGINENIAKERMV